MSKGSKIVPVRIEESFLEEIYAACHSRNLHSRDEEDSISSWIKKCIREKLDHLQRSKKRRKAGRYRCAECGNGFDGKDEVRQAYDGDTLVVSQCVYCIAETNALSSPPIE